MKKKYHRLQLLPKTFYQCFCCNFWALLEMKTVCVCLATFDPRWSGCREKEKTEPDKIMICLHNVDWRLREFSLNWMAVGVCNTGKHSMAMDDVQNGWAQKFAKKWAMTPKYQLPFNSTYESCASEKNSFDFSRSAILHQCSRGQVLLL